MVTKQDTRSDLAIPPGDYIAEVLEVKGMTQTELAKRMGRPLQAINEIIKGVKAITSETALQLAQVLNVSPHIWLGLESEYRLIQAEQQETAQIEKEKQLAKEFPYSEMAKNGWVESTRDPATKVRRLREFLGVASLENLSSLEVFNVALRCARRGKVSPHALLVWLRAGLREAEDTQTAPYSKSALESRLAEIRALTTRPATEFGPGLKELLRESGVALVYCRNLRKVNGATFWIHGGKAVILLTVRGKYADIFWFSLFHEIGHIMLHGKRETFVEFQKRQDTIDRETEADAFAGNLLIPPSQYKAFVSEGRFTAAVVRRFAARVDIHSGIVVGRLQHDGHIGMNQLNRLRRRLQLVSKEEDRSEGS